MGRAPCCDKDNVKKGPWSAEEDAKLKSYIEEHGTGGNWIALPHKMGLKRCGKSCRLRWLNYLRPNIKHGDFSEEEDRVICSLYLSIGSRWSIIAAQLPGRTDNDIKNYWNTRLKKKLLGKQRTERQARRGNNKNLPRTNSNLNQGVNLMREQIGNYPLISGSINTNLAPSWPELPTLSGPIPYSSNNQDSRLNDQESIRILLTKLGGKFYEDELKLIQDGVSVNPVTNQQPFRPSYTEMVSSGESSSSSMVYNNLGSLGLDLPLFGEVGYANPQIVEGIEFLYEEMVENRNETACGISNSFYPPFDDSNYEGLDQEGVLQGCNNDDQLVQVGGT